MPAGRYRQISGNLALAYGLVTAARKAGLPLFLGAYPITPASDVLHELSKHKRFGVTTFQAEDEIAGVGAALGASFAGHLGVTTTSGPGISLKSETIALGVMTELPLVICDIQRAGPSTGMPTKTEQADLLQVMFGRNGEAPVPVLAAQSPADCFPTAIEAVRIAVKYRTPVIVLSDGYIANGAEPWPVPDVAAIPPIDPQFAGSANAVDKAGNPAFLPYLRDPETLARPWAIPGTAGLQHRIGGIEKAKDTGAVSYDPANHEEMVRTRAAKIAGIVRDIPDLVVERPRRRGGPHGPGAGAGLGLDVRADRGCRPPGAQDRPAGGVHAPAAPQPVPGQPRRHPAELRPGDRARDEPRPAGPAAAGGVPGGRAELLARPRAADLAQRAGPRPGSRSRRNRRSLRA